MKVNFCKQDLILTQDFGVMPKDENGNWIYPGTHTHDGIDLAAYSYMPDPEFIQPFLGKYVFARWDAPHNPGKGYGQRVIIRIPEGDHFVDLAWAHCGRLMYDGDPYDTDGIFVKEGADSVVGEVFAKMGNTGFVRPSQNGDGRHTHFSAKPVDKNGNPLFPNNGTGGYIDPTKYLKIINSIKKLMELFQIIGEATLAIKDFGGVYHKIETAPEFYPILAANLGLDKVTPTPIAKSVVEANLGKPIRGSVGFGL